MPANWKCAREDNSVEDIPGFRGTPAVIQTRIGGIFQLSAADVALGIRVIRHFAYM